MLSHEERFKFLSLESYVLSFVKFEKETPKIANISSKGNVVHFE